MSSPQIAKLVRPQVDRVWPRERVFTRLDRAGERGAAVWVHGPPGAGKTCLVSSYADSRRRPTLWYQIDERDEDPATLLHYLAQADAGSTRPDRRPLTPPGAGTAGVPEAPQVRRFFEALFAGMEEPHLFVLDNYHELPRECPTHDVLRIALEMAPNGVSPLILSREAPPPSLARMRAHGAIEPVGSEDLLVNLDEALEMAALRGEHAPRDVERFVEISQGWAAGLVLLFEQTDVPVGEREAGVLGPLLFDYFAAEVFERLGEATQDALLATALLPRATEAMADRMAGGQAGGEALRALCSAGYFTARLPGSTPSYQLHPLFRAFLLERARRTWGPVRWAEERDRAAQVLLDAGMVEDAVEILQSRGDWNKLAEVVLAAVPELYVQGRFRTLERFIAPIPRAELLARPWLLHWFGAARLPRKDGSGRALLVQAHRCFVERGDVFESFWSWASIVDSILGEMAGVAALDPWIDALDALLARFGAIPGDALEARVTSSQLCALRFRRPGSEAMHAWIERAYRLLDGELDEVTRLLLAYRIHECEMAFGEPGASRQLRGLARRLSTPDGMGPIAPVFASLFSANAAWMVGDAVGCLDEVNRGIEASHESGGAIPNPHLLSAGVHAALLMDDVPRAQRFLERFQAEVDGHSIQHLQQVEELGAELALRRSEWSLAQEKLGAAHALARRSGVPFFEAQCQLGMALCRWEAGDHAGSLRHLDAVAAFALRTRSVWLRVPERLYRAGLALDLDDSAMAASSLREGLGLARETGCRVFSWWHPSRLVRPLAKALADGIETEFVRSWVRERDLIPDPAAECGPEWPWPVEIRALGGFEVQVEGVPIDAASHRRPLELLQVLIACGPEPVPEDRICDLLWPDSDGDAAHRAFKTTLHRLRRLVGHETLQVRAGRLSLERRRCLVDVDVLHRVTAARADDATTSPDGARRQLERLLALYAGPLLGGVDAPFAQTARESSRSRFVRTVASLAGLLERSGEADTADALLERALDAEPFAEVFYQGRIRCLLTRGQRVEAERVYARCQAALEGELGSSPSPETRALLRDA